MDAVRYDVLREDRHWLLTDGRSAPRLFMTSVEAVQFAMDEVSAREVPAEIYVWRTGQPERIYSTTSVPE